MTALFETKITTKTGEDLKPETLSIILWSFFSGVTLWEAFQQNVHEKEDTRAETVERAFRIFDRGMKHAALSEAT